MLATYIVGALAVASSYASPLRVARGTSPTVTMTFTGGPASYTIEFQADGSLNYISAAQSGELRGKMNDMGAITNRQPANGLSISQISATGIDNIYTACTFQTMNDATLVSNADGSLTVGPPTPIEAVACNADAPAVTTTNVTFFQGGTASAGCSDGAHDVAAGVLTNGTCQPVIVSALSIASLPNTDCTFTLFTGSQTCSGSDSKSNTDITAGTGQTCIYTNVLDGGNFQKASGIWSCAPPSTCVPAYGSCAIVTPNGDQFVGQCCAGSVCAGTKCIPES